MLVSPLVACDIIVVWLYLHLQNSACIDIFLLKFLVTYFDWQVFISVKHYGYYILKHSYVFKPSKTLRPWHGMLLFVVTLMGCDICCFYNWPLIKGIISSIKKHINTDCQSKHIILFYSIYLCHREMWLYSALSKLGPTLVLAEIEHSWFLISVISYVQVIALDAYQRPVKFELHFNLTRYSYLSFIFPKQVLITPKVQTDLDKGNVSGFIPDNILVEFLWISYISSLWIFLFICYHPDTCSKYSFRRDTRFSFGIMRST